MTDISHQPLQLQLTPMQVASTTPIGTPPSVNLGTAIEAGGLSLLVRPGEPSEIVAQLENRSNQPLALTLHVDGNFPPEWCQVGMEGQTLAPRQRMDAVIRFQVPDNFFETAQAISPGQALQLDYACRVYVSYAVPLTEGVVRRPALLEAGFALYLRPHTLYPDFLPAIYREVDFLGRFLSLFEQAFEPAVDTLEAMWAYLDPLTAPRSLLPFLAYWVAWPMDPRWGQTRQRRLIRHAMDLYRWRGTRRGLRLYLHLYTDLPLDEHIPQEAHKHIGIEERFGDGFAVGGARVGHEAMLGGGRPYHFTVHLRAEDPSQIDANLVRYIIDREKPVFCTYDLFVTAIPNRTADPPPLMLDMGR